MCGFKTAIQKIIAKYPTYSILLIEGKSDNVKLNDMMMTYNTPTFALPTAYYFYNFAYATFQPENAFILI